MRLLYKGWLVFSQPLRLLVALSGFVVAWVGTAPGGLIVRLGIDTLIANILAVLTLLVYHGSDRHVCHQQAAARTDTETHGTAVTSIKSHHVSLRPATAAAAATR